MRLLIAILFVLFTWPAFSQVTITGRCTDESGKPIAYASITILHPETKNIIAFKSTDAKGAYSLSFRSNLTQVIVRFSLINFETIEKTIDNKSQTVDFNTHPQPTELENVNIRPPATYQRGDTIVHDVQQFANANDRTLSDVIKKMPGVEVDESGKISYQGKEINQFNVEGRDLMQGGYGIIPNSIPYSDVDKFEIIEHNQPIKMLKDKMPSFTPGVNIKLKKNISLSGSGKVGVGATPFLWSANITPMLFTKKQQALFTLKSNNIGENVTSDLGVLIFSAGMGGIIRNPQLGSFLSTSSVSPPSSVKANRYWFNKSHALSANVLIPAGPDWELKTNNTFSDQHLTLKGSRQTTIMSPGKDGQLSAINYNRASVYGSQQQKLRSVITLEKNGGKNFVKENFTFNLNHKKNNTDLLVDDLPTPQHLSGTGYSFENSLSTLLPVGKKNVANLSSYVSFFSDPQSYRMDSLEALQFTNPEMRLAESFLQNISQTGFSTTNSFSMILTKGKWNFNPSFNLDYSNNGFTSDITTFNKSSETKYPFPWQNDIHFRNLKTTAQLSINRKTDNFYFSFSLPLSRQHIKASDKISSFDRKLNKTILEPSLYSEIKLTRKFKFNANASRSYGFSDIRSIYPGFVFSGLNFRAYESLITTRKNLFSTARLVYKNLLKNIDANTGYSYSHTNSNTILAQEIADNGQSIISARELDNSSQSHSINTTISKYFTRAITSLSVGHTISIMKTQQLVNDNLFPLDIISNNLWTKADYSGVRWLSANYTISYSTSKRTGSGIGYRTHSLAQTTRLIFDLNKAGSIIGSYESNRYNINQQNFQNQFLDLSYRYTFGKRKTDLELKWVNVLNTRQYREVILSSIQTSTTLFKLRPSQVLLSVRTNLRR